MPDKRPLGHVNPWDGSEARVLASSCYTAVCSEKHMPKTCYIWMALPPLSSPCLPDVNICARTSHMYSTCSCMASNQIVELVKNWELKQIVCIVTWDLVGSSTSSHLEICSSCCSLMGKMCSEVWESCGHNQLYSTSVHGAHSGSNGCSLSFQKVVTLIIIISVSDSVLPFFCFVLGIHYLFIC